MKQWLSLSAVAAVAIALLAIRPGFSDDETKPAKTQKPATAKPAAEKKDADKPGAETKARKPPKGRLPNYYGQIGLSEEQRLKIYAVQDAYEPQIAALKQQMAELFAKQTAEIDAVLTETQREQLLKAREESKKQALEKAQKAAAAKAAGKTVAPKDE